MDNIIGALFEEKKQKEAAEKERQFLASIKLGDIRAMNSDQALVEAGNNFFVFSLMILLKFTKLSKD